MARPNIPVSLWVPQRPREPELMDSWLDVVANWIDSVQNTQKNELTTVGVPVGSCQSVAVGEMIFVQGVATLPASTFGVATTLSGIPVAAQMNTCVTLAVDSDVIPGKIAAGSKDLIFTPTGTNLSFSAWYFVTPQQH